MENKFWGPYTPIFDNHGNRRADYYRRLREMTDKELRAECSLKIWLSAYALNNPRSDYHFMCDGCADECDRRGKSFIYAEEHQKLLQGAA